MKQANAVVVALALAVFGAGCVPNDFSWDGALEASLLLPDRSEIEVVNYTLWGGPNNVNRSGMLQVEDSTRLDFRIGNLPVGPGYNLSLTAMLTDGTPCAASTPFDISSSLVADVELALLCGDDLVDDLGVLVVEGNVEFVDNLVCPEVTGVSAAPTETVVGSELALEGFVSSPGDLVYWFGNPGTFSNRLEAVTNYTCIDPGVHTITFVVAKAGCIRSRTVDVTCTAAMP